MMKISKKLIGIGIASLGVILSVGGAIALYTKAANNAQFNINGAAYAGSTKEVTYKINNTAGNAAAIAPTYCDGEGNPGGVALSPAYPQVKYEFILGGDFEAGLPAQDFVMGNVSVALTNLNSTLYNKVTVYASVTGYAEGKIGASAFGTALVDNITIADAETACVGNRDISVAAAGVQKLTVWVKVDFEHYNSMLFDELSGDLYDLDVAWGPVTPGFTPAYVVSNHSNWVQDDEFAMAVNINADGYEWMYKGLPGSYGPAKVVCGDTWCHAEGNHDLDPAKTYDVYWTAGGDATFVEQA